LIPFDGAKFEVEVHATQFAFAAFDRDHKGKITFSEFIRSTAFLIREGSSQEDKTRRLDMAFDIFGVRRLLFLTR
jgi:hypothetical protein